MSTATSGSSNSWGPTASPCSGPTTLISAVGQLNRPAFPAIPGIDDFEGISFHSARWEHDVDLAGRRVAVIGTGCSAAQFIPTVADEAAHLTVFQRTPNWLAPAETIADEINADTRWLFDHVPSYAHWWRLYQFWRMAEGMLPAARVDPEWEGAPEPSVSSTRSSATCSSII